MNTTVYAWFGPPLGAAIWVGAIVATGALTWLLRRRPGWLLTGVAFALQLVAMANYFARVEPVNIRFRALAAGQVPGEFNALRTQWELGHALGFVLFVTASLLLMISLGCPAGHTRTSKPSALVMESTP